MFVEAYEEIRSLARVCLRGERRGHTLDTTALVHEAYVKLSSLAPNRFSDRAAFCCLAARAIRQILVDHARARRRLKRGGDAERIELRADDLETPRATIDVLDLDEALCELEQIEPRCVHVVELRYLVGMSAAEAADATCQSLRAVQQRWRMAKAWLQKRLGGSGSPRRDGAGP
ncbi:MAG: ECF-type sigma factor [Phycisphaerae bacterium]